jgi:MFS family permease
MELNPVSTSEKTPWGRVVLFVGAGVVVSFQVGKAPPVLPDIRAELGMGLFLAGWILSTINVTGLLLGSTIGAVADSFGHRRLLIWGLLCQAAASLTGSLSQGATTLLATRIVEGLGLLMIAVSAPALIVRVTRPQDMRLALSAWSCWLPAGAGIIMLLTPLILSFSDWRGLWQLNALILTAYAFWVSRKTPPLAAPPGGHRIALGLLWRDIRRTSTSVAPALLALIFSTYTFQWLAVMGFLPTLLVEDYGLSSNLASVLTAMMVAMNVPGNLTGGWLLHRGLRRWPLIATASLLMGLCSLAIYSSTLPFFIRYLGCLIFSGVGGLLPASVMSAVPVHAPTPELIGTTNGLIVQGAQLGQVVGPPALALIVSKLGGWASAPWLLLTAAAAGVSLSVALGLLERRHALLSDFRTNLKP